MFSFAYSAVKSNTIVKNSKTISVPQPTATTCMTLIFFSPYASFVFNFIVFLSESPYLSLREQSVTDKDLELGMTSIKKGEQYLAM